MDDEQGPSGPPPPPPAVSPGPEHPITPSVPPVGNVAPGRGPRVGVPSPVAIVVGLIAAAIAFFFVQELLDPDRVAPTAAEVEAAFVPIDGYEYIDMPDEAMEPLRQAFAAEPVADEAIEHFDARQLTQAGRPSAVVFILAVDPDSMSGDFEDNYVNGFTATSQASVDDLQLGDTTGHIAETPMGTIAFFFDPEGYVFNVVGRDPASVTSVTRALEAGN